MDWKKFQKHVFELIEVQYASKKEMMYTLCEILNLESTSVYQRVNLSQKLSLPELLILMKTYKIAGKVFAEMWKEEVMMKFPSLVSKPVHFSNYIDPLLQKMEMLSRLSGAHVSYAANELPFYHFFAFHEIALFKYYAWSRVAWMDFEDRSLSFSHEWIQMELASCRDKIAAVHSTSLSFASTEVWHTNILFNTLNQIRYFRDIGLLSDKQIITLLVDQLSDIVKALMDKAARGFKDKEGVYPFHLYHNEVAHTNNIAVIQTSFGSQVLFAYDNPNVMESDDSRLTEYTLQYISRLIQHSENLTASSERSRARCFAIFNR